MKYIGKRDVYEVFEWTGDIEDAPESYKEITEGEWSEMVKKNGGKPEVVGDFIVQDSFGYFSIVSKDEFNENFEVIDDGFLRKLKKLAVAFDNRVGQYNDSMYEGCTLYHFALMKEFLNMEWKEQELIE